MLTSLGPSEVKAGKGAHKAERPTKCKGPLPLWAHLARGSLYLLRFCVGLYTYIWPFSCTWGPFTSLRSSPSLVVGSGLRRLSVTFRRRV